MTIHNIQQDYSDTTDHWYLIWSFLSTIIGLFMTACIISTARIHILARKLKITRRSKGNITKDLEVLERDITTRKDIACTSNKIWAHKVESMKIQDPPQILEQHDLQSKDKTQEFKTPINIYPGIHALPPAYNHKKSIIHTTKEFMEASKDCDKDNQVVMYDGLVVYSSK